MPPTASDVCAWALNVGCSVIIVFVNKRLMSDSGYGFKFANVLTGIHFLLTAVIMGVATCFGLVKRKSVPLGELVVFVGVANLSIGSLNASLMVNPVSFYQICKVLITPCTCLFGFAWQGTTIPPPRLAAIALVLAGVAAVTVEQVESLGEVAPRGVSIAAVSVVSSALQMLCVGRLQQKHKLSAQELLAITSPAQAASLLAVGPAVDHGLSGVWASGYQWTPGAACYLLASCLIAVLVNASQYLCIGRFSAHAKTVLVLLVGLLGLGEPLTERKAAGMAAAVVGMAAYSALPATSVGSRRKKKGM